MQVVGYETAASGGSAALRIAEDGVVRREQLEAGVELSYTLEDRHCAGAETAEGHIACDTPVAPYCDEHTSRWPCARCRGDCGKPLDACDEEHVVYLAAFAPAVFKVGVTRSWRLETRLREQGADRAAHVRTVSDGRIARRLEADWAREIPDRVRVPEKVTGLHLSVDEAAWEDLLGRFTVEGRFGFDYGLGLESQPVAETVATGSVRGTKGRVLLLDRGGTTYAVDLRELVGHELSPGDTDRDLQASLGSF